MGNLGIEGNDQRFIILEIKAAAGGKTPAAIPGEGADETVRSGRSQPFLLEFCPAIDPMGKVVRNPSGNLVLAAGRPETVVIRPPDREGKRRLAPVGQTFADVESHRTGSNLQVIGAPVRGQGVEGNGESTAGIVDIEIVEQAYLVTHVDVFAIVGGEHYLGR